MNISNFLFILGAPDPEMERIESLLKFHGAAVAHATSGGKRVHPGNAYKADGVDTSDQPAVLDRTEIFFVECDLPGAFGGYDEEYGYSHELYWVDHHRTGDPGHGTKPEYFLNGSSLGQVYLLLAEMGVQFPGGPGGPGTTTGLHYHGSFGWYIGYGEAGETEHMISPIPFDHVYAAAADHCPAQAYQGQCPGVDPDMLMEWRAETRAQFQGCDPQELLDQVRETVERLESAQAEAIRIHGEPDKCISIPHRFGGKPTLPELPEAAMRLGVAVEAQVKDRDGRTKRTLMGNTDPALVQKWMDEWKAMGCEVYGSPERGYAGAYLDLTQEEMRIFRCLQDRAYAVKGNGTPSHEIQAVRHGDGTWELQEVFIGQ